jgi:hypothetical protein
LRGLASSITSVVTLVALTAGAVAAQPQPRARTRTAAVSVTVLRDGRAKVQARYEFIENPGLLSFELLQQRCAVIGPVRVQANGTEVPYARDSTGPWLRLHDTSSVDSARAALGYALAYDVELRGREVSIPVLLPLAVLRGSRRGESIATVTVRLPPTASVIVPRMTPTDDGRWSATMAALPAAVRIRGVTPNAECEHGTDGESGKFKLIFWALVTTLVLWVPTYMWWANRQHDPA